MSKQIKLVVGKDEATMCEELHRKAWKGLLFEDRDDSYKCNNIKDKLKTTPAPAIKSISKTFRVDWGKVFKRGWLLWK